MVPCAEILEMVDNMSLLGNQCVEKTDRWTQQPLNARSNTQAEAKPQHKASSLDAGYKPKRFARMSKLLVV